MKKIFLATAASLAAMTAISAPAMAATEIVLVDQGDGNLTGQFGESGIVGPMFESEFFFELPENGFTSGSISSVRVSAMTDIDFTEVLLNGQAFTFTGNDINEVGFINALFTTAGTQELIVRGTSGGNGSFAGTISFIPAIPEPGTWALMLLGFAAVGFSLRRSKPEARETRVRYNFA